MRARLGVHDYNGNQPRWQNPVFTDMVVSYTQNLGTDTLFVINGVEFSTADQESHNGLLTFQAEEYILEVQP